MSNIINYFKKFLNRLNFFVKITHVELNFSYFTQLQTVGCLARPTLELKFCFLSPAPSIMAFIVFTKVHEHSPQPTPCRSPACSFLTTPKCLPSLPVMSEVDGVAIRCQLILDSCFTWSPHHDLFLRA